MSINLDDLERLARDATRGPWRLGDEHPLILSDSEDYYICKAATPSREPDMRFIAALDPDTVLALLRVVRAAVPMLEIFDHVRETVASRERGAIRETTMLGLLDAATKLEQVTELVDALAALNLKDET